MKSILYKNNLTLLVVLALLLGGFSCNDPTETISSDTSDEQKEAKLNQLFTDLKQTEDPYETEVIQAKIWDIWMVCNNKETSALMQNGLHAMEAGDYDKAVAYFTQIIQSEPYFAEAWNKRATSFYMMGKTKAAIDDIEKTLVLEDRHFGALSGLATIYMMQGEDEKALKVYERIARIAPAEPHIQYQIQYLRSKMGISQV